MKCPHCTNGVVALFSSSRPCEKCGGSGQLIREVSPRGLTYTRYIPLECRPAVVPLVVGNQSALVQVAHAEDGTIASVELLNIPQPGDPYPVKPVSLADYDREHPLPDGHDERWDVGFKSGAVTLNEYVAAKSKLAATPDKLEKATGIKTLPDGSLLPK